MTILPALIYLNSSVQGYVMPGIDHLPRFTWIAALAAAVALSACGQKAQAPQAQTPQVGVVTVKPERVSVTTDLPGRTSAFRIAEVRARVDGIIVKRDFTEGSDVRAGQRLYQIDPAPYRAALNSALATLTKAEANLQSNALLARRYKALISEKAVSQQEYDNAVAAQQQAQAEVAAGKAAVETARINLGYTDVTAPISGRIGKSLVTEGAYVQQNQATQLATIQQLDTIYVDVAQSSAEVLRLRRELTDGQLEKAGGQGAQVALLLEDGSQYADTGTLQFSDISVDTSTGTITLRATFPNKNLALLPGMFVHARVQEGVSQQAILVPQQGVTYDLKGQATALVVGAGQKVELRQLTISRALNNQWLVTSGLAAGDRVIVEGLQKIHPGVEVKAVAAETVGSAAATAQSAPGKTASPLSESTPAKL